MFWHIIDESWDVRTCPGEQGITQLGLVALDEAYWLGGVGEGNTEVLTHCQLVTGAIASSKT